MPLEVEEDEDGGCVENPNNQQKIQTIKANEGSGIK